MAKRRKKVKRHKARRVGAVALNPNSTLVKLGSVAAGFLLASTVNTQIDKVIPADKVDPKLVAAGQVGLGALYLMKKGRKSLPLTILAGIAAGSGAKRALTAFGMGIAVNGYQMVPAVNGYQNIPVVGSSANGGYLPGGSMNGYPTHRRRNETAISGVGNGDLLN